MPIQATCPCGNTFNAPSKYAGQKVKCPKCKEPLTIPTGKAASGPKKGAKSKGQVTVACACGKKLKASDQWIGKTVKCPECGKPLRVGGKAAAPSNAASSPMQGLLEDVGLADNETGGNKCPECRSAMKPEAVVCIDCGYNANLGRKMKVQRPVTADDRAQKVADRNPDPATRSAAGKKGNPRMILVGIGLLAVVGLVVAVVVSRGGN